MRREHRSFSLLYSSIKRFNLLLSSIGIVTFFELRDLSRLSRLNAVESLY